MNSTYFNNLNITTFHPFLILAPHSEKMGKVARLSKQLDIQSVAINDAALVYRAIYHPLRLRIIQLIHKHEKLNVTTLVKRLKQEQSLISFQLGILREAEIVEAQREGQQVIYAINYHRINQLRKLSPLLAFTPPPKHEVVIKKKEADFKKQTKESLPSELLDRELTIIRLICEQKNSEEIGKKMKLSKRTVEDYRRDVFMKTKAKNVVGVVLYAIRHKLYKVN